MHTTNRAAVRQLRNDWLAGLLCVSLIVGPMGGCPNGPDLGDLLGVGENAGLFVNNDFSNPLLMAGRNDPGDGFFVYGTRDGDGNLEEIEAIVVRQTNGDESFITFESGRPRRAQGPRGSFVDITYTEVSTQRLAATVEFYNADDDVSDSFPVEIDLQAALQTIVSTVQDITGQALPITEVEEDGSGGGKIRAVEQTRVTVFSPLFVAFVLPIVALVAFTQLVLGQILIAIQALIVTAVQGILFNVFAPLFIVAELLNVSITRVQVAGIGTIFDTVPDRPEF